MSTKRKHPVDSDDDEELWNEAALIDEAIIRTQASQRIPSTQCSLPLSQLATQVPSSSELMPPPNYHSQAEVTSLQSKLDEVMKELVKKSREKTELMKEINKLKSRKSVSLPSSSSCDINCKKKMEVLSTDLRFKENELILSRNKIKELSQKKSPDKNNPKHEVTRRETFKTPMLVFPTLQLNAHQDFETIENFLGTDNMSLLSRKHFLTWCYHRGDLSVTDTYLDVFKEKAPLVFQKLCDQFKDDTLTAAFLGFLSHIQNLSKDKTAFCEIIPWQKCVPNAHHSIELLLSLTKFLRNFPNLQPMFGAVKAFVSEESSWAQPKFEKLLNAVMSLIASMPLTYESQTVAKTILRIYRHTLHSKSNPTQMELLLTSSLRVLFMEGRLEGELVSVVTRAEAFHHLGDVLKKFIRWQPTVSLTGCPEMMEIAENSFRTND